MTVLVSVCMFPHLGELRIFWGFSDFAWYGNCNFQLLLSFIFFIWDNLEMYDFSDFIQNRVENELASGSCFPINGPFAVKMNIWKDRF